MHTYKKTAISVGVLFILGTVVGILSATLSQSSFTDPNYLTKVAANENQIIIAALAVLVMGFVLALIPALMLPIFKQFNEALAMGYLVFRGALETVFVIATAISWLFLIIISQEYVSASTANAGYLQTLGTVVVKGKDSINSIVVIVFCLGALMLYSLFYQSNLIPRWISGWGFIAIVLHLTTGILVLFHTLTPFSTIDIVMNLPILLQEMVMALWLIIKGFNISAITSISAGDNHDWVPPVLPQAAKKVA